MKTRQPVPQWRYSLRWCLRHQPCPGPPELVSREVPAGSECPPEVADLWRPGTGYAVCLDFQQSAPVRRWTDERRAKVRRRNLELRVAKAAPLFADELIAREIAARPVYFEGKRDWK